MRAHGKKLYSIAVAAAVVFCAAGGRAQAGDALAGILQDQRRIGQERRLNQLRRERRLEELQSRQRLNRLEGRLDGAKLRGIETARQPDRLDRIQRDIDRMRSRQRREALRSERELSRIERESDESRRRSGLNELQRERRLERLQDRHRANGIDRELSGVERSD